MRGAYSTEILRLRQRHRLRLSRRGAGARAQVSIGDGWMPYIVRPLVEYSSAASSHRSLPAPGPVLEATAQLAAAAAAGGGGGGTAPPSMNRLVALFFLLFFFAAGICLLGVVHAILLDEFMVAVQEERQRLKEEEIDRKCITSEKLGSPLDPLIASLAHFHSSSDLTGKIKELFLMIDANGRCGAGGLRLGVVTYRLPESAATVGHHNIPVRHSRSP